MYPVMCTGPGPHAPEGGHLGDADTLPGPALCAPCALLVPAPDPVADPGTAQATVDVAAYDAAVARAKTATTVAGLRSAVLDLAAAITPAGT